MHNRFDEVSKKKQMKSLEDHWGSVQKRKTGKRERSQKQAFAIDIFEARQSGIAVLEKKL